LDPMSAEELEKRIARAVATDLKSGQKQELKRKSGSRCHFFVPFRSGPYDVQLRLDWGDIVDGFPRLDADFYDPETGKMVKSMRGHLAHHTDAEPTQNMLLYVWEFHAKKCRLRIDLWWLVYGAGYNVSCGSGSVHAVNPPDCVSHGAESVEQVHEPDAQD